MVLSSNSEKGFTLVGVFVAVILITIVLVSIVGLMGRSDDVASLSRQRFAAASLAREGLELTRSIRDTNWFQSGDKTQWLNGICDPGDGEVEFAVTPTQTRVGNAVADISDAAIELEGEGITYERIMRIDCSTQDEEPQYVLVTADVQWEFEGNARQVEVREKLYNWFPSS